MEQIHNTISEAAKKLHVGSHVLRFWEDELHLNIPRNKMGHRIYSTKEMQLLEKIIQMKKEGYSLKEIETVISPSVSGQVIPYPVENTNPEMANANHNAIDNTDKMVQFKAILGRIVSDAIRENSDTLTTDIASTVSNQVSKELDFLFREKDESDEKRFRELDETIRSYQKARQEVAATQPSGNKAKNRHLFGKK